MARNTKATETKKPTHNLVIKVQTEDGYSTVGRLGLFEGNGLHEMISAFDADELNDMPNFLKLIIEEFSDERKTAAPKLAFAKAK